jgi:hypothetical protein
MAIELCLDFPPEVVQEREQVYTRIRELLAEQTLEAVCEARRLHMEWLARYPNDYVALDAGEVLAMAEEAHRRTDTFADTEDKIAQDIAA